MKNMFGRTSGENALSDIVARGGVHVTTAPITNDSLHRDVRGWPAGRGRILRAWFTHSNPADDGRPTLVTAMVLDEHGRFYIGSAKRAPEDAWSQRIGHQLALQRSEQVSNASSLLRGLAADDQRRIRTRLQNGV